MDSKRAIQILKDRRYSLQRDFETMCLTDQQEAYISNQVEALDYAVAAIEERDSSVTEKETLRERVTELEKEIEDAAPVYGGQGDVPRKDLRAMTKDPWQTRHMSHGTQEWFKQVERERMERENQAIAEEVWQNVERSDPPQGGSGVPKAPDTTKHEARIMLLQHQIALLESRVTFLETQLPMIYASQPVVTPCVVGAGAPYPHPMFPFSNCEGHKEG